MNSTSVESAKYGLKILGGKCYVIAYVSVLNMYKLILIIIPQTLQYDNYLHSIYVVLRIMSNLEMILENICRVRYLANG